MISYLKNRLYYELTFILANFRLKGKHNCEIVIPKNKVRKILKKNDLYFDKQGIPKWWFSTFMNKRNTRNPLTNAILRYLSTYISKDAKFLITGCGTGGQLFWLAQQGFSNLHGFDYLQNVVDAANEFAKIIKINANIWQDNAFNPTSKLEKYDVILALHWIFSAWAGNYGNKPCDPKENLKLLNEFMSIYTKHLSTNGIFCIELIDSIADFKVPPSHIYPIRHSSEQVSQCASELGLSIEKKMFCGKSGWQPTMIYIMRKK